MGESNRKGGRGESGKKADHLGEDEAGTAFSVFRRGRVPTQGIIMGREKGGPQAHVGKGGKSQGGRVKGRHDIASGGRTAKGEDAYGVQDEKKAYGCPLADTKNFTGLRPEGARHVNGRSRRRAEGAAPSGALIPLYRRLIANWARRGVRYHPKRKVLGGKEAGAPLRL